ncbi:hypothetical protein [Polymorphobacter sp.]|uniref:hypothetical protein n=1 Tax=Polymorphobacter sp. TaxID=1909290 RepID=UPI003F6FC2E1
MTALPRARGTRPVFLESEQLDDLLATLMALTQEVAVLRERCDTSERLLAERGVLPLVEIEAYRATADVEAAREQWRQDYLDRVLYAMRARGEQQAEGATIERYQQVIAEVGS